MIDKQSPLPLYYQVKEDIIRKINEKELMPGQRIEGEVEFTQKYGVSQITIRKALSDLVTEGYLCRVKGKGTYVAEKRELHKTSLLSFTEEMRRIGYVTDVKVIEIKRVQNERVAKLIGLESDVFLIKIKRLRLCNGGPMGIQTSFIPAERIAVSDFDQLEVEKSVYQILSGHGIRPSRAREKYRAIVISNGATQKLLQVGVGEPAFFVERYTYDQDGTLFEFAESILRGDKYELETEMTSP